jgi:hypothetical protein
MTLFSKTYNFHYIVSIGKSINKEKKTKKHSANKN